MFGGLLGLPVTLIAMHLRIARSARPEPLPQEVGVHAIGPLLDLMITDVLHGSELRERLTGLLRRLQPEDASALEAHHYDFLNGYLHRQARGSHSGQRGDKVFLLAVLDAYSRIGDARALQDVERIAEGNMTFFLHDSEVRSAAQRCLPHLQQIAEQIWQQRTLLRSSQASSAPNELLRPATATTDPASHQLLRAINDEDTKNT